MPADVNRIEPDPTHHSGAVRRVGPRRRRDGQKQRQFEDEAKEIIPEVGPQPPSSKKRDRVVSPPSEEDGGTRVNVVG